MMLSSDYNASVRCKLVAKPTSCTLVTRAKSLPMGLYSDIADVLSAAIDTIYGRVGKL